MNESIDKERRKKEGGKKKGENVGYYGHITILRGEAVLPSGHQNRFSSTGKAAFSS